jgi:alpha-L-rhamnosidase
MNSKLALLISITLAALHAISAHAQQPQVAHANGTASIADFGAIGDGKTLNSRSIQTAIDQLAAKGGGTLVIPKGVFVSGALFLKPGVNLHLDEGAVLSGSTDRKDYPATRTRIEGHFEQWLPALLNADKIDHLRISGSGTLNGNGAPFWKEFMDRYRSDPRTKNLDVPRPRLVLIQNSDDVQISGLTFKNSSFWNLHLYRCKNVLIEKMRFEVPAGVRSPCTDGTDIDSCQNITIRGCVYQVDDDCICLKGSKGPFAMADKDSPPVEHIRISNCKFERGHGVVTVGSEATLVHDVVVENCEVFGSNNVLRLKLRPDTPQHYEDIHYRNIKLDGTGTIVQVLPWKQYFDLKGQPPPKSIVRNVTLSNVRGTYGSFGDLRGNAGQTEISDVTIEDVDVTLKNANLNAVNVKNLKLENVIVNGKSR